MYTYIYIYIISTILYNMIDDLYIYIFTFAEPKYICDLFRCGSAGLGRTSGAEDVDLGSCDLQLGVWMVGKVRRGDISRCNMIM